MIVARPEGRATNGLIELCKVARGKRVVEIGSYLGESAVIFAKYFDEVFCVDDWGAGLRAPDMPVIELTDAEIEAEFDGRMAEYQNICKVKRSSPAAADYFPDRYFDLVYIDGDHSHDAVIADIKAWLPKSNRFIAGHDCETVFSAVTIAFNLHYIFEDSSWLVRL